MTVSNVASQRLSRASISIWGNLFSDAGDKIELFCGVSQYKPLHCKHGIFTVGILLAP